LVKVQQVLGHDRSLSSGGPGGPRFTYSTNGDRRIRHVSRKRPWWCASGNGDGPPMLLAGSSGGSAAKNDFQVPGSWAVAAPNVRRRITALEAVARPCFLTG
jgi:hypothetical protein